MEKAIKIYHVETQEDYDVLMIKLEAQGYIWITGAELTVYTEYWDLHKENTCIILNSFREGRVTRCSLEYAKEEYPEISIIKRRAGDTLELETDKAKELQKYSWSGYRVDKLKEWEGAITWRKK